MVKIFGEEPVFFSNPKVGLGQAQPRPAHQDQEKNGAEFVIDRLRLAFQVSVRTFTTQA